MRWCPQRSLVWGGRAARQPSHVVMMRNGNRHHARYSWTLVLDGSSVASASVETCPLVELWAAADEGTEA